jgi:hypothetical protein
MLVLQAMRQSMLRRIGHDACILALAWVHVTMLLKKNGRELPGICTQRLYY